MPITLQVSNLNIGYKVGNRQQIVSGPLQATLNTGELVCIMGLNGAGKSTFLRTVAGLQEPISGSVEINGININAATNQEKATLLAVVLTGRTSSQYMTIRELVELGRYPHTNWKNALRKSDNLAVENAIAAVGLTNDQDRPVSELSDGNAQKAMIARAIAQDTQLIILDEPTVHLDLRNKLMILELLSDLSKQYKKTILLASHDLNMMVKVADKIWLFDEQNLIAGIPEDLMNSGIINKILGSEDFKPSTISKNELLKRPIAITGSKEATYWLSHALLKSGYVIEPTADINIKVSPDSFKISFNDYTKTVSSIEETLITITEISNE